MYFYDKALALVRQGVPFSLLRSGDVVTNLVHLKELSARSWKFSCPRYDRTWIHFWKRPAANVLAARGR